MADKKKVKSKKKGRTRNPSNCKGGEGQRVKNRPQDNLFIGDAGRLPNSMYRYKDPQGNINLQPLQSESASIKNYMQQQDARMQSDIPSDLVRSSQLEKAVKQLSRNLMFKLKPQKDTDIVMKEQGKIALTTKSTGIGTKRGNGALSIVQKTTKDQGTQKFRALTKSGGTDPIPELTQFDFKPKKPQTSDFIQQVIVGAIDIAMAQQQNMYAGDNLGNNQIKKRSQQQLLKQEAGSQRQQINQYRDKILGKISKERGLLLQQATYIINDKQKNPITVNYNVANNTSNFQLNTELQKNQYTQQNTYENIANILSMQGHGLLPAGQGFPQLASQQVGEHPPSNIRYALPAPNKNPLFEEIMD